MDKKAAVIALVALLAIAGGVFRVARSQSEATPRANPKPFEQLGVAVAEETAKVLASQGSVVLVVETMDGAKIPNLDAQINGFKTGLAKVKSVSLKAVKELSRSMTEDPRAWPQQQAAQLVGYGVGAKALVFFGSFPSSLSPGDLATLKGSQVSLVVVGPQSPLIESLVKSGVIRVAIVGRVPPKPAPNGTETPAQWFDRVYAVLKAP